MTYQRYNIRWCGAMAAQLICNQWVAGSTPVTSSKKSRLDSLKSRRLFLFITHFLQHIMLSFGPETAENKL